MLDAALQGLAAAMPAESLEDRPRPHICQSRSRRSGCSAMSAGGPDAGRSWSALDDDGAGKLGRITLMDDAGTPTAEVTGIYLRRVQRRTVPLPLAQKVFDTEWVDISTRPGSAPATVGAVRRQLAGAER